MALSDFGKAFKAARDAGDTEFSHGGKKYTTRKKGESDSTWKFGAAKRKTKDEFLTASPRVPDRKSTRLNSSH